MSKRPKEVYGKKLIYRYSAPVIFTLLFSLIAVAAYVLTFFLPYVHMETYNINGMSFVYYVINLFTGDPNEALDAFANDVTNNVFGGNAIFTAVIQVWYFMMIIDLVLMGIFAIILAITCLVLIFSGRLKNWKLPYKCISGMFYPGLFFFYTTVIALNIYAAVILKITYYDGLYSYIFLGTLFVLMIIVHIIHNKAFKNHVYVKNQRTLNMYIEEYEKENMVIDTTKPEEEVVIEEAPKIVMPVEEQEEKNDSSDNRKKLPKGLKHIGGHAFSQNTALEEADIPLGIEVLGAGAFANCVNLKYVHIPESVKKIEYNCFFNCIRLEKITYGGSREMWKRIKRGSNWLTSAGTKFVVCRDGALAVNPEK